MKKDLVSIIITTYDGVKTIEFAVLSALNQTYKNIEVIVVDDNGLNSEKQIQTKNVLNPYIDSGKITYYPHEKNMNGSAARNTGAKFSNGEWLSFLDDDDIYMKEKIYKELVAIKNHDSDMAICGGFFIDQNGRGYKTKFKNKDKLLKDYLTEKVLFNTSTFLIRKRSFNTINGFDDSFKRHQDWEFFTRAFVNLNVIVVNEVVVAKYKFDRNTASNPKIAEQYINHFFDSVGDIIKQYDEKDYIEIYRYQMIRIGKNYYYNNQKSECRRLLKKIGIKNIDLIFIFDKIKHLMKKILFGFKKRYYSYSEIVLKLKKIRSEILNEKK